MLLTYKILLDPGHHKYADNVGVDGYLEGVHMLDLAKRMRTYGQSVFDMKIDLTRYDMNPVVAGDESADLRTRGEMSEGYDLMYSLHTDASGDPEVQGSTLYGDINPKNANHELFEAITEAIEEATGFETKGVRYRENSTYAEYKVYKQPQEGKSNFYSVLYNSESKLACLVEHGFHTNRKEAEALRDPDIKDAIAKNVIDAIAEYMEIPKRSGSTRITTEEFIKRIKDGAIDGWRTHEVLPSLTLAQAILESDSGNSELAVNANALFGIKAHTDKSWPKTYEKLTWEWVNGKNVQVKAAFKAYNSWNESLKDRLKYLVTRFINGHYIYASVIGETDYKAACRKIYEAGYATDPNYPQKLIGLIEKYGLQQFDTEAMKGNDAMDVIVVAYVYDGDLANAMALFNALRGKAVLYRGADASKLKAKEIIQVGGAEVLGATKVLKGANRVKTLLAIADELK